MLETTKFVLPTPQGGATELSQEAYRCLTEAGGLSPRQRSAITIAAQILGELSGGEAASFPKMLERIYGVEKVKPTSVDWHALYALLRAGLIRKIGGGSTTRYCLPDA